MYRVIIAALIGFILLAIPPAASARTFQQTVETRPQEEQPLHLRNYETQIVYLTNLKRQDHGLPPLRWNRQLSEAARWFSEDAILGRGNSYCGHVDSLGRSPGARVVDFGYTRPDSWAHHVVCGYVLPAAAVEGWFQNATYRQQLLSPSIREVGVGYYLNTQLGKGFVSQVLSSDPKYAPVVIENEAPATQTRTVSLYIYDAAPRDSFSGIGASQSMMIANEPSFAGAAWQPYRFRVEWELSPGQGWKSVYVKTRDALGRVKIVEDTIFLGPAELADISLDHASSGTASVAFEGLDTDDWDRVQLRLNWHVDDRFGGLRRVSGSSVMVTDSRANGGTAHRLLGSRNSQIQVSSSSFYRDLPLTAYFHLKVDDNRTDQVVAEITVNGGGKLYGPLNIRANQFDVAGRYQEFALPFLFHDSALNRYLTIDIKAPGSRDLYVDGITFYQRGVEKAPTLTWYTPDDYNRGNGVWVRFVDNSGDFSRELALNPLLQTASITIPPPPAETEPFDPQSHANRIYLPVSLSSP